MTYFFHSAARVEHLDNVAFYESRQIGLGRECLSDFEAAVARVLEKPDQNRVVSPPGIRRLRLDRFPFWLIYRVESESVQILAVAHIRRRPSYWVPRI